MKVIHLANANGSQEQCHCTNWERAM